ncbi:NAD-dependent epimerase/dehydratase family protein [Spirosoma jeollabukense]
MNALLTGASGFLGSRIYRELIQQHTVTTLGRTVVSNRHIHCDLTQARPVLLPEPYDIIIHSAGKAHAVPRNVIERADYERVNVYGISRLLNMLERSPILPKSFVHISTVLVYGRSEGQSLTEMTPLDAKDAYGLSKIMAEDVVRSWAKRNGVRLAILRLPLVVAENPRGNLSTMIKAIKRGYYVHMGTGSARRSMVRADDVAAVIIRAAEVGGIFNLTDGYHPSVREVEESIARQAGKKTRLIIPLDLAKALAYAGDGINALVGHRFPLDSIALQKLTHSLTFSDELARKQLDWHSRPVLDVFR